MMMIMMNKAINYEASFEAIFEYVGTDNNMSQRYTHNVYKTTMSN